MSLTATSRRPARSTRLTAAAIATPFVLGAVLTGCSAGQVTQTAEKRPSVEGEQGEVGDLKVLNAHFVAPTDEGKYQAGDTVEIEFVVTSGGPSDELTGIDVDGAPATIVGASSIEIPAGDHLIVGENGDITVEATMTDEVYPSALIPVTFTFAEAGELEIELPIAASLDEIPRDPDQTYSPEEGGGH
ncbi:MAG: hypothetical protein ACK5MR_11295 [Cumulibacter sp.]